MDTIENIVRQNLCTLLQRESSHAASLNLDDDLVYEYGFASIDRIVLMTSICEQAGVALTAFDEDDIGALRTPRAIVQLLSTQTA
ncbi:acyl carrier protein [Oxalobacteraceae bacterium]|nr:acyl carrier protein [Oxalobacteraceae bacterium]